MTKNLQLNYQIYYQIMELKNKLEDLNGFFDPSFAINEINNDFRIKNNW
jgi:hypothetical protein